MIRGIAPAKVNLVLRIGPLAPNGLHEVCSLFASVELHDVIEVEPSDEDRVLCRGVDGPNLAGAAIRAFRQAHPDLPPLVVRIEKRIPVAAGMAGGSADAAAVLRAANAIAGRPFDAERLREIGAPLGSDVPSQVEPAHAVVTGTGERVRKVDLPPRALVLVPAAEGLSTADVFRRAEQMGIPRDELDCRDLYGDWPEQLENDLQAAALDLRPELQETLDRVRAAGAADALVSGSGPTVFGVFEDPSRAERAAAAIPHAVVTMVARR